MFSLLGGVFLGWALGANDASNVIGPAVSSKMLRFRTAAVVAALFVLAGALLQGRSGVHTLSGLTGMTLQQAVIVSVAAAASVTIMTVLRLPVSSSQAVVGAILGIGVFNRQVNFAGLGKVVTCWVGTPIGGALAAILVYRAVALVYNRLDLPMVQSDGLLRVGILAAGIYGAYALGANNVANVTAVFVEAGYLSMTLALLVGGLSIGLGIVTFGRPVMNTVGSRLVRLDCFSAFVVLLAEAITVHFYTFVGVPVSTSQAIVGAVLGIGILKGTRTVSKRTLAGILFGWFLTPVVAGGLALAASALVLAQTIADRTETVKQEVAKDAASHAALCGSAGALPQDNSLCLLCHANFRAEPVVTDHLAQGITCAHCHGISTM
ncbi:MAG: anion permease, partial [bacterium]